MTYKFIASAIIQISSRFFLLCLSILLARWLGTEGFGIYAYAFALLSILSVVAQAGMPQFIMRQVARFREEGDQTLLIGSLKRGLSLALGSAMTVAGLGGAILWIWWSWGQGADVVSLLAFAAMLVLLPFNVLCVMVGNILRGLDRVLAGQMVEVGLRPLLALMLIGAVFFNVSSWREPSYAILAQTVVCLPVLAFGLFAVWSATGRNFSVSSEPEAGAVSSFLRKVVPFASLSFASVLNGQVDILILGIMRTSEEVGIYRIATQGAMLVAFGLHLANVILAPRFVALSSRQDLLSLQRLLTKTSRYVFCSALPLGLLLVVAGAPIVEFVFGHEYGGAAVPLAILSVGQIINVAFGSVATLLLMTGYERRSAQALWFTVALNIVLNTLLISTFGVMGAAVGTLISLIVWNMLLWRLTSRKLGLDTSILGLAVTRR